MDSNSGKNDFLKLVGLITMTIDHLGAVAFPDVLFLRIIGRIAFPLFAYKLAEGVRHTGDIFRYGARIAAMGIISQPIYAALFGEGVNVMADLFIGVVVLGLIKTGGKQNIIAAMAVAFLFSLINWGYGAYGMACFIAFYFAEENRKESALYFGAATLLSAGFESMRLQGFAIFSLPFIWLENKVRIRLPQYLFYAYYPANLYVIGRIFGKIVI